MAQLLDGLCNEEPKLECPVCGNDTHADWVDIGFGPFSQQAGPRFCVSCGWVEPGCPSETCLRTRCVSWEYCGGKSLIKEQE